MSAHIRVTRGDTRKRLTIVNQLVDTVHSVLKTPRTAAQSPRKSVAFFTSIGFAPMGGSAANKIPVREICPPPVCGFELLPACLKNRSVSRTGAIQ